jgi:tRNA U34 2-thiouridine synthase MnmA/TrmU
MTMKKSSKFLILLSGGLDSLLALGIMVNQEKEVEVINFRSPFSPCDDSIPDSVAESFGIEIHQVFLGQEYLDMVINPEHGYGSQMNPCIDCRILMFKKAKEIADRIGAKCIVTGEVLNERPFSQRKDSMLLIEREAGLRGRVLRPLSAKLLPETECEKKGFVDRDSLFSMKGRRRLSQIELAKELDIPSYPNPSGGCILTDPYFSEKLRDFLQANENLTLDDIPLLKIGRHFRFNGHKIIVGRNEIENRKLLYLVKKQNHAYLEVENFMGPITVIEKCDCDNLIKKAAEITVRYSDAPGDAEIRINYYGVENKTFLARAAEDDEIQMLRISSDKIKKSR